MANVSFCTSAQSLFQADQRWASVSLYKSEKISKHAPVKFLIIRLQFNKFSYLENNKFNLYSVIQTTEHALIVVESSARHYQMGQPFARDSMQKQPMASMLRVKIINMATIW